MIKANDDHVFDTTDNGVRFHIYARGAIRPVCGAGLRKKNNTTCNEVDESTVCLNCRRIAKLTDAYTVVEEVPEQTHSLEVVGLAPNLPPVACGGQCATCGHHGCAPQPVTDNSAEERIAELKRKGEELCQVAGNYMQVTRNHTLENIKIFMETMPPAEDLDGYELRWGMPKKGESFVEALKGQTLWGVATADFDNPMARWLIRTPIVSAPQSSSISLPRRSLMSWQSNGRKLSSEITTVTSGQILHTYWYT
jgi:hypothetical protein